MEDERYFPRRFNKMYTVAAGLTAGSTQDIGITEQDSLEFSPFNTVMVVNTSAQLVEFIPNGDITKAVPVVSSWALDDANFKTASIKNMDAAVATSGDVYVLVMNTVNFRTLVIAINQIFEKFLKRFGDLQ